MSSRQAEKLLRGKGVKGHSHQRLSHGARENAGLSPPAKAIPALSREVEDKLVDVIKLWRALKLPVAKWHIMAWAEVLIKDTPAALLFKNQIPTEGWYYRFLDRT
ncbi:hypothetical protein NFJ02_13g13810 [Pycnococcus provasolii]